LNYEILTSPNSWIKKKKIRLNFPAIQSTRTCQHGPAQCHAHTYAGVGAPPSARQAGLSRTAPRRGGWMEAEHSCSGKANRSEPGRWRGSTRGPHESHLPLCKWCSYPSLPVPVLRRCCCQYCFPDPWLHHFTPTPTSAHGLAIPGRSIAVPKLPQPDTEEAIKVSMTALVSALLVSGELKLRLLTSIFSTQVLHLIIQ